MEFRIINQEGTIDVPYSMGLMLRTVHGECKPFYRISTCEPTIILGEYSDKDVIIDVLRKVRNAYSAFIKNYGTLCNGGAQAKMISFYQLPKETDMAENYDDCAKEV